MYRYSVLKETVVKIDCLDQGVEDGYGHFGHQVIYVLLFLQCTIELLRFSGLNSIVLYLGSYIAWQMFPFNFELAGGMGTHWRRLPESIWGVSCWLMVAYILYANKVFITV